MRGGNPSLNHASAIEINAVDEINQRGVISETTAQVVVKTTMFPPGRSGVYRFGGREHNLARLARKYERSTPQSKKSAL